MKKHIAYLIVFLGLASAGAAFAQNDPGFHEPPQEHVDGGEAEFMGGPPDRPPQHGGRQLGPLERWMEHLEKRDPEESERLKKLHQDDQEAFMHELHERLQRLQQKRALATIKKYPNLYKALMKMPEDERDKVLRKLSQLQGPGQQGSGGKDRGPGMGGPPPGGERGRRGEMMRKGMAKNTQMRSLSRETREIALAYHQAGNPEGKETIRNDLRLKLDELFELREQQREQQIEQVQGEVDKLRALLEQRRTNKDAIIDKRLLELTADETTKW